MLDTYAEGTVDATHRYRVEMDDSPANPRTDADQVTGAYTHRSDSRVINVEPCHRFPGDLSDAAYRLKDDRSWNTWRHVIRWAKIFHDINLVENDGTFWWVDPVQFTLNWKPFGTTTHGVGLYAWGQGQLLTKPEIEAEVIKSSIWEYQSWADGSVFYMVVEQLKAKAKIGIVDDEVVILGELTPEDLEDQWVEIESFGGIYLNEDQAEDEQFLDIAKGMC